MNMRKNQLGFTGVEVLLLLIFLAIIGFTGYYVYHAQKTSSTNTKNSTTADVAKPTDTKKAPAPQAHTSQDAVSFVQATYDKYLSAEQSAENNQDMQPTGAEGLPSIKDTMTTDAYSHVTSSKGGSGFTCTIDQSVPASVTTALTSHTDTQAIVSVSEGGTPSVSVTVDLNALKITAVNCVTP